MQFLFNGLVDLIGFQCLEHRQRLHGGRYILLVLYESLLGGSQGVPGVLIGPFGQLWARGPSPLLLMVKLLCLTCVIIEVDLRLLVNILCPEVLPLPPFRSLPRFHLFLYWILILSSFCTLHGWCTISWCCCFECGIFVLLIHFIVHTISFTSLLLIMLIRMAWIIICARINNL